MRSTRLDDGGDSTAPDPRPRLRRRFFASLVLIGLLVGLMIGRLTTPEPARLLAVESVGEGLLLRFSAPAQYRAQAVEGAYALLLQARGGERDGQLQVDGQRVRWRIQAVGQDLLLNLVALRPLQVQPSERQEEADWLLELRLAPADEHP